MRIVEITRKGLNLPEDVPQVFSVGQPAVPPAGHIVSEILYCRDGYSNGAKGRRPCYAVKFETSEEIRLIPENEIVEICLDGKKKAEENPEANVSLPTGSN